MENKTTSTLYELRGDFLRLYDMASDPDTDPEAFFDTMEAIEGEIEDKADSYAAVIASLKNDSKGLKAEEDRLSARRKAIDNSVARMMTALTETMQATGKTRFKTLKWSFGIQPNPESVVLDKDISGIPAQYLIEQEPKVDKMAIKDALKHGAEFTFAHLERSESLRIR